MLRVFENFEWEVPLSGDDGGGGIGKNDKIGDLGAAQALQICCPGIDLQGDKSGWGLTLDSGPEWLLHWTGSESLSPTTSVTLSQCCWH